MAGVEDHLRRIKGHRGEVKLSDGAFDYYWDWRREIEESAEPAVRGWVNRLGDNAFKVAMIYEASVGGQLAEIGEVNMKLACSLMSMVKTELVDLLANELAWTEEGKELQKVVRRLREAGKNGNLAHSTLEGAIANAGQDIEGSRPDLARAGRTRGPEGRQGGSVLLGRVATREKGRKGRKRFRPFFRPFSMT